MVLRARTEHGLASVATRLSATLSGAAAGGALWVAVTLVTGHVGYRSAFVLGLAVAVAAPLERARARASESSADRARNGQEHLSIALSEALDLAQEQERVRAQLTHDARNACAGVRASLEILLDHEDDLDRASADRLRQVALFGMTHLEEVISDCDPYARSFSVDEVARRVVDSRRLLGSTIALRSQDDLCAYGRPHDFASALLNLLVNAERHAPGRPVAVEVSQQGRQIRVCVADTGPGISLQHREDVFQRGWRRSDSPGQGLGLHTARELMRGQSGDLTLLATGGGATFVLTMPAATDQHRLARSAGLRAG